MNRDEETREIGSKGAIGDPVDSPNSDILLNGLALAAQIFWGPEPELCRDMVRGEFRADLEALGPYLNAGGQESIRRMRAWVLDRDDDRVCPELEDEYLRLFVNAREGLKAPLYHSHYESADGTLMGRPFRMMTGLFREIGIDPAEVTPEPADHLSMELEYLFLLLEAGTGRDRPDLLPAALEFARNQMLPWLRKMVRRLVEMDNPDTFYIPAAELVMALLEAVSSIPAPDPVS